MVLTLGGIDCVVLAVLSNCVVVQAQGTQIVWQIDIIGLIESGNITCEELAQLVVMRLLDEQQS